MVGGGTLHTTMMEMGELPIQDWCALPLVNSWVWLSGLFSAQVAEVTQKVLKNGVPPVFWVHFFIGHVSPQKLGPLATPRGPASVWGMAPY